jgi:hypothetical protein
MTSTAPEAVVDAPLATVTEPDLKPRVASTVRNWALDDPITVTEPLPSVLPMPDARWAEPPMAPEPAVTSTEPPWAWDRPADKVMSPASSTELPVLNASDPELETAEEPVDTLTEPEAPAADAGIAAVMEPLDTPFA